MARVVRPAAIGSSALASCLSPSALWLVFLLAGAGCGGSGGAAVAQPDEGKKKGQGDGQSRVLVRLGELQHADIAHKLAVSADLEAIEEADVYPEISRTIRDVRFREGDFVRQDDPVVILVDDELRLQNENKGILHEQAKTKAELGKVTRREGEAVLEQKKLLLEKAEKEYARILQLAAGEQGIISREEADAKRYDRDQCQIDAKAAALQVEKHRLEETQAEQNLHLAEVELKTAAYNLSRTVIRSPIDGVVSYLDLKVGEMVSLSAVVFSVVNLSRLQARLHVPQRDLSRLKVRQRTRITCEVYPEKEFWGEVVVINPVISKDSGAVRVTVEVSDPEQSLKPGMFINGEIILDTHSHALLAPKKAVIYENQEPVIYMVHGDVARRYVLTPGYSSKEQIEVLALTGMDGNRADPASGKLVLVGQNNLKDGSLVEVE
jgi:RND family efflux transporter MFP subunit